MFVERFEKLVVAAMTVLLMAAVVVGTAELFYLFFTRVWIVLGQIETAADFQAALQNAFGGVLLVLVGLELIATVRQGTSHFLRLELVFIVALIALGRHILQVDLHQVSGSFLAGLAALVLALAGGFWLIRSAAARFSALSTGGDTKLPAPASEGARQGSTGAG